MIYLLGFLAILAVVLKIDIETHRRNRQSQLVWAYCPTQTGGTPLNLGTAPGSTSTFAANPQLAPGVSLPLPFAPVWTSSDPVNAPVAPSADGLTASVSVPSAFVPASGASYTLTVSNPDGSGTPGTVVTPYEPATVPDSNFVTSYGPQQTS